MHRETEGSEQAVSALVRAFYVCVVSFFQSVIEDGEQKSDYMRVSERVFCCCKQFVKACDSSIMNMLCVGVWPYGAY